MVICCGKGRPAGVCQSSEQFPPLSRFTDMSSRRSPCHMCGDVRPRIAYTCPMSAVCDAMYCNVCVGGGAMLGGCPRCRGMCACGRAECGGRLPSDGDGARWTTRGGGGAPASAAGARAAVAAADAAWAMSIAARPSVFGIPVEGGDDSTSSDSGSDDAGLPSQRDSAAASSAAAAAGGGGKNAAAAAAGGGAMAASGVLTRPSETDAHRCAVVAVEAAVPCTVRGGGSDARDPGEISGGGDGISSSNIGGGGGGGGSGGDDGASRLVGRARWVRSSEAARVPHRDARAARPGRDARRRALRDGGSCRRGGDCYDFSAKHRERYTHNDDGGGGAARRPVRSSGAGLARAEEDAREALTAALAELAGTTASAPLDALAHVRATAVHVMRHDGARWETLRDEIVTAAATGAGARGLCSWRECGAAAALGALLREIMDAGATDEFVEFLDI